MHLFSKDFESIVNRNSFDTEPTTFTMAWECGSGANHGSNLGIGVMDDATNLLALLSQLLDD